MRMQMATKLNMVKERKGGGVWQAGDSCEEEESVRNRGEQRKFAWCCGIYITGTFLVLQL